MSRSSIFPAAAAAAYPAPLSAAAAQAAAAAALAAFSFPAVSPVRSIQEFAISSGAGGTATISSVTTSKAIIVLNLRLCANGGYTGNRKWLRLGVVLTNATTVTRQLFGFASNIYHPTIRGYVLEYR